MRVVVQLLTTRRLHACVLMQTDNTRMYPHAENCVDRCLKREKPYCLP